MKILFLIAAVSGADYGLFPVIKILSQTFSELSCDVEQAHIAHEDIPFYDGETVGAVKKIASQISSSAGVVFCFTTHLFSPCACMQNFFEHLTYKTYARVLKNKHALVLTASKSGGEASALDYAGKIIRHLGGLDTTRFGFTEKSAKKIDDESALKAGVEKCAEDYYRAIRQNRAFIVPLDYPQAPPAAGAVAEEDYEKLKDYGKKEAPTIEEIKNKYDLDSFTRRQEDDIKEITEFFAGKYKEEINITPNGRRKTSAAAKDAPPRPRVKTTKQMTQSLAHYYKPQAGTNLNAVFQVNITGQDGFECFLTISDADCEFSDGTAENPDITIICESSVWADVLNGKYSAQKAFMVGYLKVRGNFVLLTKFDSVFFAR